MQAVVGKRSLKEIFMAARNPKPQTGDFSFAGGGLAGNNAQGKGFLAAALDAKMTPAVLTCTSGQIYWTYLYLTGWRCHANLNLRREVRKSQLGLMLPSRLATSGTRCP